MNKNTPKTVRNPLAMIAIFAGTAEVAMSYTLSHISASLQSTFIWFVMLFPFVLVGAFFFILYRKPAVLFSPSDYEKDEMYLSSISADNEDKSGLQLKQLQESVNVLEDFMEQIVSKDERNGEIEKKFAETKKKLSSIHKMEYNSFFTFLTKEIKLSNQQIVDLIERIDELEEIPQEILKITQDERKSNKVSNILNKFPESSKDFSELKIIVRGN